MHLSDKNAHVKIVIASALAFSLVLGSASPLVAYADEQSAVEATSADYNTALDEYNKLQDEIEENKAQIKELQIKLPEQRKSAAKAIRSMYKLHQGSPNLLTLILSTDDFKQFISMVACLDSVQNKNFSALDELAAMQDDLNLRTKQLDEQEKEAKLKLDASKEAMDKAIKARQEAQARALAQQKAEEAKAKAAIEAAQKDKQEQEAKGEDATFETEGGNKAPIEVPSSPVGPVDWSEGKTAFVNKWSVRIDNYLAGSPLAGHGRTFAESAWDYGVDPRWSPAISCVESGKGRYCFRSHNAWGWGRSSWSDWDTAIRSHVAGLGSPFYGGHHSLKNAQAYCPPNAQHWYSAVANQMNLI